MSLRAAACMEQPGYCCPLPCKDAPPQIAYCPSYLIAQGVPFPINYSQCTMIRYGCCYYNLSYQTAEDCTAISPGIPQNVGTVVEIYTPTAARPCCSDRVEQVPYPTTCLWTLMYPEQQQPQPPFVGLCQVAVAEDYQFADQYGTVKGMEPKVESTVRLCYETFGYAMNQFCGDACPPITYFNTPELTISQSVGKCDEIDTAAACPGQRTYMVVNSLTCEECNPCGQCCPPCGDEPCPDPETPGCTDPSTSYIAQTCYSVETCQDNDQDELVLSVSFVFCEDIDLNDQAAVQAAKDEALSKVAIIDAPVLTNIGYINMTRLDICDGQVWIYSGNAISIANAANAIFSEKNIRVEAADTEWATCMWFGTRQTCTYCCAIPTPPGCYEPDPTRPPFSPGDTLYVQSADVPNANTVIVRIHGVSQRKYVCACQTVTMLDAAGGESQTITHCAVSIDKTSGANAIGCLSMAEYSCGERYSMRNIEELLTTTYICVDDGATGDPLYEVRSCDYRAGYPLQDVYIGGILVTPGFVTVCPSMPTPASDCYLYPYIYGFNDCCPTADCVYCNNVYYPTTPTYLPGCNAPVDWPKKAWQDPGTFCETSVTTLQVT
jgi:hypothetical protein